jgi:hypothetical protein
MGARKAGLNTSAGTSLATANDVGCLIGALPVAHRALMSRRPRRARHRLTSLGPGTMRPAPRVDPSRPIQKARHHGHHALVVLGAGRGNGTFCI